MMTIYRLDVVLSECGCSISELCLLRKLLVTEYGQFKHVQREETPKLV